MRQRIQKPGCKKPICAKAKKLICCGRAMAIDSDVMATLRATGDGWQTRINGMLRASLRLGGGLHFAG